MTLVKILIVRAETGSNFQNFNRKQYHMINCLTYVNVLRLVSLKYACIVSYIFMRKVLVGKPEGKRPLGRPRRRWEDNIKMDL